MGWRTAVAIAVAAALGLLLARLPISHLWWTGVFSAIALTGLVAVAAAFRYPVKPPAMPRWFGYDDITAASKRIHRGQPVDPPELQVVAILRGPATRRGVGMNKASRSVGIALRRRNLTTPECPDVRDSANSDHHGEEHQQIVSGLDGQQQA